MSGSFSKLVMFFVFTVLLSCAGGGSTGTGGFKIEGTVVDSAGTPLEDVVITDLDSGNSTSSDKNGYFSLDIAKPSDENDISINVTSNGFSADAVIEAELNEDGVTSVTITINTNDGSLDIELLEPGSPGDDDNPGSGDSEF